MRTSLTYTRDVSVVEMLEQRKEFVRKLVNYLRDGSHIVYLDETTTFIHDLPKYI